MRRVPKWMIVSLAVVSALITIVLLPITTGLLTGYLSALPPGVETWVKEHIFWLWAITLVLALPLLIQAGISASMQSTNAGNSSQSYRDLDATRDKVTNATNTAVEDPLLMRHNNQFQILSNWKQDAETLIKSYNDYKKHGDKESKHATTQTVDLLEKLLKHTKRSFIFLHRKGDFSQIASLAYNIVFEQKRWVQAANLAYEVGRVYHELGRHKESNDWIEPLRTCLEYANFDGYWVRVYNGIDADQTGALDGPNQPDEAKKLFQEALAYAAKLYDLEGLNKQDDNEAEKYFNKALTRAAKLPDKLLHSWVEIHRAELALRLSRKPATHYTDALAPFKALDLDALDPPKRSDIVNLMLTCYYQLGRLGEPTPNQGPNAGITWYQLQLGLAEKYGSSDFQVLAHERLAYINLLEGLTQTSTSNQSTSFQNAYEHAKKAWSINKSFSDEGPGIIEPNALVELMINIMDGLITRSNANPLP